MSSNNSSRLRFLVYGAGAIGSYVGGSLALLGMDTVFVERPEIAAEIRKQGICVNRTGQVEVVHTPTIVGSIDEALTLGPYDLAIFAVKAFDTAPSLINLAPYRVALPPFLSLQNGVENEATIASILGPDKVLAGSVTTAIGRLGPGNVVVEKQRGIGVAKGHPLVPALVEIFNQAGLNAHIYRNAQAMKWSKMITNLLANATSAILDVTPAEVFKDSRLCRIEILQIQETVRVMKAMGLPVVDLPGTPVRSLIAGMRFLPQVLSQPLLIRLVGKGRGAKMPSFHIDLHSNRGKSEVDFLNGAVVRFGDRYGIPTPVNRALTQILSGLTRHELAVQDFAHRPEALLSVVEHYTKPAG